VDQRYKCHKGSQYVMKKLHINPLTRNDLYIRRADSPLKIKIPSKNTREKPINIPTIHSVC
jgi:hypothetical protein